MTRNPVNSIGGSSLSPLVRCVQTFIFFAGLWIGLSFNQASVMHGYEVIHSSLSIWSAIKALVLGNLIVGLILAVNGHIGVRCRVSFRRIGRVTFGRRGVWIPIVIRGVFALIWMTIQILVSTYALFFFLSLCFTGGVADPDDYLPFLILTLVSNVVLTWVVMLIWYEWPILFVASTAVVFVALFAAAWAWGLDPSDFWALKRFCIESGGNDWGIFMQATMLVVAYWITMTVNISDFTLRAEYSLAQGIGQIVGLIVGMVVTIFVGATVVGSLKIADQVFSRDGGQGVEQHEIVSLIADDNLFVAIALCFAVVIGSLTTNVIANYHSVNVLLREIIPDRAWGKLRALWQPSEQNQPAAVGDLREPSMPATDGEQPANLDDNELRFYQVTFAALVVLVACAIVLCVITWEEEVHWLEVTVFTLVSRLAIVLACFSLIMMMDYLLKGKVPWRELFRRGVYPDYHKWALVLSLGGCVVVGGTEVAALVGKWDGSYVGWQIFSLASFVGVYSTGVFLQIVLQGFRNLRLARQACVYALCEGSARYLRDPATGLTRLFSSPTASHVQDAVGDLIDRIHRKNGSQQVGEVPNLQLNWKATALSRRERLQGWALERTINAVCRITTEINGRELTAKRKELFEQWDERLIGGEVISSDDESIHEFSRNFSIRDNVSTLTRWLQPAYEPPQVVRQLLFHQYLTSRRDRYGVVKRIGDKGPGLALANQETIQNLLGHRGDVPITLRMETTERLLGWLQWKNLKTYSPVEQDRSVAFVLDADMSPLVSGIAVFTVVDELQSVATMNRNARKSLKTTVTGLAPKHVAALKRRDYRGLRDENDPTNELTQLIDDRDSLMIHLLLDHGLRAEELASLERSDVDTVEGLFTFTTVAGRKQTRKMSGDTWRAAKDYGRSGPSTGRLFVNVADRGGPSRPMSAKELETRVESIGKSMKLKLSIDKCRMTWAETVRRNGWDIFNLDEFAFQVEEHREIDCHWAWITSGAFADNGHASANKTCLLDTQDMVALLAAAHPTSHLIQQTQQELGCSVLSPYGDARSCFYGRKGEKDKIRDVIRSGGFYFLLGRSDAGKSSILYNIQLDASLRSHDGFQTMYIDFSAFSKSFRDQGLHAIERQLVGRLCSDVQPLQLKDVFGIARRGEDRYYALHDDTPVDTLERLIWLYARKSDDQPLAILMDELDEFLMGFPTASLDILKGLRGLVRNRNKECKVSIIAAGRSATMDGLLRSDALSNFGESDILLGLDPKDARDFVERPLRALNIPISQSLLSRVVRESFQWPSVIEDFCVAYIDKRDEFPQADEIQLDANGNEILDSILANFYRLARRDFERAGDVLHAACIAACELLEHKQVKQDFVHRVEQRIGTMLSTEQRRRFVDMLSLAGVVTDTPPGEIWANTEFARWLYHD